MTKTLRARNVNGLYQVGLDTLEKYGHQQNSRAGDVMVAPWPVVSIYDRSWERVLFDEQRDANPFFHLMEALWMLAGRDDAQFLDHYVGDFGKRFSEEGGVMHGAYGYRWRREFEFDQLDAVVEKLRDDPNDRQAVLQMWDARAGDYGGGPGSSGPEFVGRDDLRGSWKDRPCNTHVYLRVRPMVLEEGLIHSAPVRVMVSGHVLDLTVCCRSNDVVWGAYGSNAVHFSVLQEYLAGRIGVRVGKMYQLSNNYHGYVDVLDGLGYVQSARDLYADDKVKATAMGEDWDDWDADLKDFMEWHDKALWKGVGNIAPKHYWNTWFSDVAMPMAWANYNWKRGRREDALLDAKNIRATDWQLACTEWMQRRMAK